MEYLPKLAPSHRTFADSWPSSTLDQSFFLSRTPPSCASARLTMRMLGRKAGASTAAAVPLGPLVCQVDRPSSRDRETMREFTCGTCAVLCYHANRLPASQRVCWVHTHLQVHISWGGARGGAVGGHLHHRGRFLRGGEHSGCTGNTACHSASGLFFSRICQLNPPRTHSLCVDLTYLVFGLLCCRSPRMTSPWALCTPV